MNERERSEFRAFVREHHPDRGGDPDVFVAGLARFGAGAQRVGSTARPDDRRYDSPVEVVGLLPLPVRVGIALIRTWNRRRQSRVR